MKKAQFSVNKTKDPIIYLICERADDQMEDEVSMQEQLQDARTEIGELKDTVKKLQEQIKAQKKMVAKSSLPYVASALVLKNTEDDVDRWEETYIKTELDSDVEVKSERDDVVSNFDDEVKVLFLILILLFVLY